VHGVTDKPTTEGYPCINTMSYTIKGQLHLRNEAKKISDKFTVQEFVITTDGQYPQHISLQASNDKIQWLDKCNIGDTLEVQFDIRGREYNGKYYNQLNAYAIKVVSAAPVVTEAHVVSVHDNDLPF